MKTRAGRVKTAAPGIFMSDNKYETKHDYETELNELMEQKIHELELCRGLPQCGYCLDERDKNGR